MLMLTTTSGSIKVRRSLQIKTILVLTFIISFLVCTDKVCHTGSNCMIRLYDYCFR